MSDKPWFRLLPLPVWVALSWGLAAFTALRGYTGLPFMPGGLPERPVWRWALVVLAIAGAAVACRLIRSRPLVALYLLAVTPAVLLLAVGREGLANEEDELLAQFLVAADIVLGFLVVTRPPWTWAVGLVPIVAVIPATALPAGLPLRWTLWIAYVLLPIVIAVLLGYSIRQARDYARRLSAQTAEQAVVAERLRISRELHDQVAHSVGVIALQAGAAARVIDTRPEKAREALRAIESTSRDTLTGLRRMLDGLRLPQEEAAPLRPAPTLADIGDLVTTAGDSGLQIGVRWEGRRRPLPADVELSAFRIVQESLTNVLRHADARTCDITFAYLPDGVRIEIVDDGKGFHGLRGRDDAGGSGYGLLGLHERVSLLHGTMSAGSRDEGGFRVAARLPVEPGEAAE
ncbi:sensor histidine kinase [Actinoplanes utahensis]|uniref:histidine kinase n=1 Tax=Actinoplanes utahensis TaxID=1869 RepID=A0A0A6X3E5_ACTUT|nr:sensor histidine kinase [Actinoplanes utahensis]KHD74637.1 hypothetical protein MB27_27430 [Actinoplanes utahensis]GIF31531.1 two-component sensor histidine kinase [Actinoplanes utahensis]